MTDDTECTVEGCTNPLKYKAKGLCSKHYARLSRQGTLADPEPPTPTLVRFMRFVERDDTTGCWMWQGQRLTGGYGYFGLKRDGQWKPRRAHRVGYELMVGPIPDGLTLHHTCGRPACVNPDHLIPVTARANSQMSIQATKTHCHRGHPLSGDNLQLINAKSEGTVKRRCKACARLRLLARRVAVDPTL